MNWKFVLLFTLVALLGTSLISYEDTSDYDISDSTPYCLPVNPGPLDEIGLPRIINHGYPKPVLVQASCGSGSSFSNTKFKADSFLYNLAFWSIYSTLIFGLWVLFKRTRPKFKWLRIAVFIYAILYVSSITLVAVEESVYFDPSYTITSLLITQLLLLSPILIYLFYYRKQSHS